MSTSEHLTARQAIVLIRDRLTYDLGPLTLRSGIQGILNRVADEPETYLDAPAKRKPTTDDVQAAVAFFESCGSLPREVILLDVLRKSQAVVDAWLDTLDLGDEPSRSEDMREVVADLLAHSAVQWETRTRGDETCRTYHTLIGFDVHADEKGYDEQTGHHIRRLLVRLEGKLSVFGMPFLDTPRVVRMLRDAVAKEKASDD